MKGRGVYSTHNDVIEAWRKNRLNLDDTLMMFNVVVWEHGIWNDELHHLFWTSLLETAIGHTGRIHYGCQSSLDKENNTQTDYPPTLRRGVSVRSRPSITTSPHNGYRITAREDIWPRIFAGWDRTAKLIYPSLSAIIDALRISRSQQEQSDSERAILLEQHVQELRQRRR